MKKLILTAIMLLGLSAQAQTTGVAASLEKGTHLFWQIEKGMRVAEFRINYGASAESTPEVLNLINPEGYQDQDLTNDELDGFMISLLGEQMPFQIGDHVCFNVQVQLLEEQIENNQIVREDGEPVMVPGGVSEPSETICALILKNPKAPESIGIIRK